MPPSPPVPDNEDLYRTVTKDTGWIAPDGHISTAVFAFDLFSVEIVSRTKGPDDTLSRVPRGCAVIQFNCGCARERGFETLDERDEGHPENKAHAHVYLRFRNKERKRRAKRLLDECEPVIVRNYCND